MFQATEHVLTDLRYAARRLRNAPGFLIVSTLLIAVSLASTTVIFGLVDVVLLRTLPVRDPASLVQLFELRPAMPAFDTSRRGASRSHRGGVHHAHRRDGRAQHHGIARARDGDVERRRGARHCQLLRWPGAYGGARPHASAARTTSPERGSPFFRTARGRASSAQDLGVVGSTVRLAGQPYSIVGVLQEGINGTSVDGGPDFRVLSPIARTSRESSRSPRILARLREGVSLEVGQCGDPSDLVTLREAFVAGGGVVGNVRSRPLRRAALDRAWHVAGSRAISADAAAALRRRRRSCSRWCA